MFWKRLSSIQAAVNALEYNFNHFELGHFLRHLELSRKRLIRLAAMDFQPDLFGIWIPGESTDYIFYSANLHSIHQVHVILHEVAHMVLDHERQELENLLSPELVAQLGIQGIQGHMRRRNTHVLLNRKAEREAEEFVFLIQKQVVNANRLTELVGQSSSIEALKRFTDGMNFSG